MVDNITVEFKTSDDHIVRPIEGVSFSVKSSETVVIVGESGSGKSVTSLAIMRLIEHENGKVTNGSIFYKQENLLDKSLEAMRKIRGKDISMIFQEPMSALNPVMTVGKQIKETLFLHEKITKAQADNRVLELLKLVGISEPAIRMNQFPHELSGGMKQRVMIAMALACNPNLLIADEPTTALDVTIEAQILKLIAELKDRLNMSVVLITHDMGVAAQIADHIVVMYAGKVVEKGPVLELFDQPLHPYTLGLLSSVPTGDELRKSILPSIKGTVPSLTNMPKGCRFSNRCAFTTQKCIDEEPPLEKQFEDERFVACWHTDKVQADPEGESFKGGESIERADSD